MLFGRFFSIFFKKNVILMEFFFPGRVDDVAGLAANLVTVATANSGGLILPALGTAMALKFLHSTYQRG
jgi:hypothetical protein